MTETYLLLHEVLRNDSDLSVTCWGPM